MSGRGKRGILVGALVLALVVASGGVLIWHRHQSAKRTAAADAAARRAATGLSTAWVAGQLATVAWSGATGAAMQTEYAAAVAGLGARHPQVRLASVHRQGNTAQATYAVSWPLGSTATWAYQSSVQLTQRSGVWLVSPDGVSGSSIFAPITRDAHLSLSQQLPKRADLLGRGGVKIVRAGPVVDVGIEPSRVTDLASLVGRVAHLTGVSAGPLRQAVAAADPTAFVPVITLRQSDYDAVKDRLQPLPGTVFRSRTQPLPLTKDFARALIGTVGPVTAEIVQAAPGRYTARDLGGVSGLQRQYDAQLAGSPSYTVSAVTKDSSGASSSTTLKNVPGTAATPVRTTLDPALQKAADRALSGLSVPGALVALNVRSGAVLAVANTPSNGLDRAVVGQYQPGSTLKVATTLALLKDGLKTTDRVSCPATVTVQGRSFRNFEHEKGGLVPFNVDFKNSCNTAFVNASRRLGRGDLHAAAAQLGLGTGWAAGLGAGPSTYTGSIPTNTTAVDQAAAAFGQGRNLVSPLAMAVLAGSVARGHFLAPTLVTSPAPTPAAVSVAAPTRRQIATLHSLMRQVVQSGTAAGKLDGVPGGPIYAKTGTAEFGSADPPLTHGWLVGWQGNIAFAAFVDQGVSGASAAGPVVRQFLLGVHGS